MTDYQHIIVDTPRPNVSRITLNRPDSRNALNNVLRAELYSTLESNDRDPNVRVTIIRGAGKAFCAGYDLKANNRDNQPFHTSPGDGNWARHVVDGFFRVISRGSLHEPARQSVLPSLARASKRYGNDVNGRCH